MKALLNYNSIEGLKNIVLYFLESAIAYICAIIIIAPIYLKGVIGTVINGDKKITKENINLTLKDFEKKSYRKSYIMKEYTIIRRSPIFFIQCTILPIVFTGTVLAIAISLLTITKGLGFNMFSQISNMTTKSWISGAFLEIAQIFYMLNFSSIIAVSKEEKWAVLSKYLPIKLSRQINMKIFIGELLNLIPSIAVVTFYYICSQNIIYSICIAIISIGLNIIGEKIKIFIDLRNPRINWDNEYSMMKKNTNVMYELFYTILVMLIFILLGFIISNINIYFGILIIVVLIANICLNRYISKNDNIIFEKLY